ncbi:unnamed protein product [Prorocentrum cordatum]|uniref:Uncharacterized protein n=1 Tax=Prorocentrum cordatum TaxID=2364126 RepID=A0ABN9P697_9DINO|nr:unnamed protein product [Polarella glacialis]
MRRGLMETVEHGRQYRERGNASQMRQTRREEAGKTQGHWTLSRSSLDDAATCTPPASGWCRAGPRRAPPLRQQKNGPVARPPTAGRAVWAGTRDANGEGPEMAGARRSTSEEGGARSGAEGPQARAADGSVHCDRAVSKAQCNFRDAHSISRHARTPPAEAEAPQLQHPRQALQPRRQAARATEGCADGAGGALPTQGAGGREARHSRAHGPALLLPLSLPQLLDTRRA